jgi:uncharacterized protein (TIGR00297 family)
VLPDSCFADLLLPHHSQTGEPFFYLTYMKSNRQSNFWQSRCILLLIFPLIVTHVFLSVQIPGSNLHRNALGISILFALVVGIIRAATPSASVLGGFLTARLIYSTAIFPYRWYASALSPLLTLFLLTFASTRFGRKTKERLAVAEEKSGRSAAQVAANLGIAALAASPFFGSSFTKLIPALHTSIGAIAMLAALAESTADTLSSELGEVLGGEPRLITNLQRVPAGTDGAISFAGTMTGIVGAVIISVVGAYAMQLKPLAMLIALAGGILGLFADSILGATLERHQWLNNDAVNFLSTLVAAAGAALIASFYQWR